jgi:DNA-binding IscR family transcriptional regulator
LFPHLTEQETKVAEVLESTDGMHVDEISLKANIEPTELSSLLLGLELNGMVRAVRGKCYCLA